MKYRFPVQPERVRKLADPNDDTIRIVHALVNVNDLPTDLPSDPDPRRPKDSGVVPKRIMESLLSNDGKFHLLNRGITISAVRNDFDNNRGSLTLEIPVDDARYGILDGGHTYWAIKKYRADLDAKTTAMVDSQFVHLEILENVDEHLADIAEARNFSVPLKSSTLAGYRKKFDWLIDALGPKAAKIIRQSENDDEPLPILDVIQILGAVNPVLFADEKPARDAYTSAGKILGYFIDDSDPFAFRKMRNIAPQVLRLYDYIRFKFVEKYNAADDSGRRYRFGARVEAKDAKNKRGAAAKARYYWLADNDSFIQGEIAIDKGFAIPIISGFRVILEEKDGQFDWLTDPFTLFDRYGDKLVKAVMNASDNGNNEPWAVARDSQVYRQLTSEVRRWYLEGQLSDTQRRLI